MLHLPFIALIDDDSEDLEALAASLKVLGLSAQLFTDPTVAYTTLESIGNFEELPVLAIVDFNMPKLNGEELLVLLKSSRALRHIPVVIYSTTVSPQVNARLIALGAHSTLVKANDSAEFRAHAARFRMLALQAWDMIRSSDSGLARKTLHSLVIPDELPSRPGLSNTFIGMDFRCPAPSIVGSMPRTNAEIRREPC